MIEQSTTSIEDRSWATAGLQHPSRPTDNITYIEDV